jgi:hypothetical protein
VSNGSKIAEPSSFLATNFLATNFVATNFVATTEIIPGWSPVGVQYPVIRIIVKYWRIERRLINALLPVHYPAGR